MESESTPSSSSFNSSPPNSSSSDISPSKFASLPIMAMKDKIVEKIAENRVTLIVGETGCEALVEDPLQQVIEKPQSHFNGEASKCIYFAQGYCNRGFDCLFSHSQQAKRPVCKFFASLQGCRNGDACVFSHELGSQVGSSEPSRCIQEDEVGDATQLIKLFPTSPDGCLLLLDDVDLNFSSNFSQHCEPSKIIATTSLLQTSVFESSLSGIQILWGIGQPLKIFTSGAFENQIHWDKVKSVFWFPNFESDNESSEKQKHLLQNFFEHLALRILADTLFDINVILSMNNIRFSQLQAEKLGRDCFFFLKESFRFDESTFGVLPDAVNIKRPQITSSPVSYVFTLHPPSDLQFGDYASALYDRLHNNHE